MCEFVTCSFVYTGTRRKQSYIGKSHTYPQQRFCWACGTTEGRGQFAYASRMSQILHFLWLLKIQISLDFNFT